MMASPTVYLISGANRGIGLGLVSQLVAQPNTVVFAGTRDPSRSDDLVELSKKQDGRLRIVKLSSTSVEDAQAVAGEIEKLYGKVDVVIANAGIAQDASPIAEVSLEALQAHFDVNTKGPLILFQTTNNLLGQSTEPKFILISSDAGSMGLALPFPLGAYGASKAAANFLLCKMHQEHPTITFLAIQPGFVQSDLGNSGARAWGMAEAPVKIVDSCEGILRRVAEAQREKRVAWRDFEGKEIPWAALAAKLKPAAEQTAPPADAAGASDSEDEPPIVQKKATFMPYDDIEMQEGDDDDDGLMSMIAKANASKKDKKKKKKGAEVDYDQFDIPEDEPVEKKGPIEAGDDWMEELNNDKKKGKKAKGGKKGGKKAVESDDEVAQPAEDVEEPVEKKGPIEAGDDWMEELDNDKKKGKKAKGGKKGGKKAAESDDEVDELADKVEAAKIDAPAAAKAEPEEAADDEPKGVLSKKEKEKLKKEKEKAKKKAQAAAKKAAGGSAPAPAAEAEAATPTPAPDAEGGDEEDGAEEGGEASSKNKKKKKKKAAGEKAPPPPPAAPKGAAGKRIAALQAMVEAQRAAAEEAERLEREERERIEAEEKAAEEEAKRVAEAKAAKKEKEKAKQDRLRKEGKLLTPKQKAEKAAAEARLKALMASGAVVAGLNRGEEEGAAPAPKRVVYAKKKRGPQAEKKEEAAPAPVEEVKPAVEEKAEDDDDDVKDSWDAESEEEKPAEKDDVKDDWDASSEEEEEKPAPAPAPVAAKPKAAPAPAKAAPAKANGKTPPAPVKSVPSKPGAKAPAKGKAAPVEESSSEEESDDDDDDSEEDSDSDDSDDSDEDSDDSDEDSEDELTATQRQLAQRKAEAKERRLAKNAEAFAARSKDDLRSPICVILGHVDTGKTKLLDKIRQTNVQEGEAGGITQQIGATYFPMDAIKAKTSVLGEADLKEYKLPGLLVIDTPGHESFTNLRTRGSSLCNIAILVIDIMHGLEPQTIESIRLLREGKTPFIIDRLYGWKATKDGGFQASLAQQSEAVKREFDDRLKKTVVQLAEQGLNSAPYYANKDFARVVSLVPTSAHTGEGVPDMLMLIIKLTQERMAERLMYISTLECTVLEVKVIEGLGTTIDVVLSNGVLREGDRIVVCGLNGAISTQVRALLTPQPMKEMRVKGSYVHHKEVKASLGIKIVAPELEKAIAGSRLLVIGEDDDEDELREEVMSDLTDLMNSVDKSGRGVSVQASTLGSLEALLEFLRTSKIPVSGINIGPVHRKDVMRAASMLEKAKEFCVILCFDVPVDREAERLADELGIKIFKADIIYHLFDQFTAYNAAVVEAKRIDSAPKAVFPVRLKTIACFAKRDPIILGCDIIEGTLRVGTPLCVVKTDPETKAKDVISLGKVTSLEINHKVKEVVKKSDVGAGVAVKIEHASYESAKQYGRHFDDKDEIIAMISRESIEILKKHFRDDMSKEDWLLVKWLKGDSTAYLASVKNSGFASVQPQGTVEGSYEDDYTTDDNHGAYQPPSRGVLAHNLNAPPSPEAPEEGEFHWTDDASTIRPGDSVSQLGRAFTGKKKVMGPRPLPSSDPITEDPEPVESYQWVPPEMLKDDRSTVVGGGVGGSGGAPQASYAQQQQSYYPEEEEDPEVADAYRSSSNLHGRERSSVNEPLVPGAAPIAGFQEGSMSGSNVKPYQGYAAVGADEDAYVDPYEQYSRTKERDLESRLGSNADVPGGGNGGIRRVGSTAMASALSYARSFKQPHAEDASSYGGGKSVYGENSYPPTGRGFQGPTDPEDPSMMKHAPLLQRWIYDTTPLPLKIEDHKKGLGVQRYPVASWILAVICTAVMIYEFVHMAAETGSPIQTKPSVNVMIGPSGSVLINMGARFAGCIKFISNVSDIDWVCLPYTNLASSSVTSQDATCSMSDICGFGGFPTESPNQSFRFFVPIFLHAGIVHLALNMIALLVSSAQVERQMGTPKFLLLFLPAGIFGFVLGANFALVGQPSVGASGAIFGTHAAILVDLFAHWSIEYQPKRKLFYLILEIVVGLALGLVPGVDNFAHIGGFLIGLLMAIVLFPMIHQTKRHRIICIVLRVIAAPLVVVLFVVLIRNFYETDPSKACSWCRYLSCWPTSSNNHCKGTGLSTVSTSSFDMSPFFGYLLPILPLLPFGLF
ncbi:hypothetical protein MNV49_002602 [Pseudohyphozyma bogoriensis]|nr:hypothetical protein MNV49_002602 [Pseudohyphozyma bogoriensis]